MQLTIALFDDRVVSVEIDGNENLATLKATLEAETGVPAREQALIHNGNPLVPSGSLLAQGVQPGDIIMLMHTPSGPQHGPRPGPQRSSGSNTNPLAVNADGSVANPQLLMEALRSTPEQLEQLPGPLRNAIISGNADELQRHLRELAAARRSAAEEEERFLRLAEEDPFNPEVQRRLEEAIQCRNVTENFEAALEYNPEAFGSVVMLYVPMQVNGVPLKAFVDSGAQTTIMGKSCAERCGLMRLLDTRFAGTAIGVGRSKIVGRVHMAQLTAGGQHIPISITVLEADNMEFLFGLDNLKRHQCSIDLKANVLRFPGLDVALPFLPEHEIPVGQLEQSGPSQSQGETGAAAPQIPTQATTPSRPDPPAPGQEVQGGAPVPAGWDGKIERLMGLGFSRQQCLGALQSTGGDEEMAGALLFGGL